MEARLEQLPRAVRRAGSGDPSPPATPRATDPGVTGGVTRRPSAISANLARVVPVSAPGDATEREADRTVDAALAGYARGRVSGPGPAPLARRSLTSRSPASLSLAAGVAPVPADAGQPLSEATRADLEPRFGSDLTQVRVHTGPAADRAARSVAAAAFTIGSHITFAERRYAPESIAGRRLLAHEIAHVVHDGESRRLHRAALPLESTLTIRHAVLFGESHFDLANGEGVVVETSPYWFDREESEADRGPIDHTAADAPPGLTTEMRITLEQIGRVWNSDMGTCPATIGAWNRLTLKTSEAGSHRLVFDIGDHNHHFAVGGAVHVRKASADELGQSCGKPEGMSGMELLHYVLDVAGLVPALGVVPDGINAVIYTTEGDWSSAGISAAAMVPILGEGATLVKLGGKAAVRMSQRAAGRLERRAVAAALRETKVALRTLRTPPVFAHLRNVSKVADPKLVELAREARITQAGITRGAFESVNVATARVRVGDTVQYLSAGNSPGRMMHSEDWILSQVDQLKRTSPGKSIVVEQLYSERIPCRECLEKLTHFTNTDMFYTVREYGSRAADLMRAYGL